MSAIKSTEIFFVHSNQKKKNFFVVIFFTYVFIFLLYYILHAWVFRVVLIPIDTVWRTLPHYAKQYPSDNKHKTQRAIVLSSPYGIRILDRLWSLPFHKNPMRGDVVLVAHSLRNDSEKNVFFHKSLRKKIRTIISLVTLNIIKPSTKYSIMRVVATEYERVSFSGTKIYEQDSSDIIVSDDHILPYVNADNVVQVPHGELFLTSDTAYGLDSRYKGTYKVSDIVGKVKFFVGPIWSKVVNH